MSTAEPECEYSASMRPLLYRPTFKLTKTSDRPYFADGWTSQRFTDERGNLYERERDGQWERWSLTLSRETPRGKVLYQADLRKLEPEDHGDCLDRIDDLKFAASAIHGLIDDARDRGLFPERQLDRLRDLARRLYEEASALEPAIAEPVRNGHA